MNPLLFDEPFIALQRSLVRVLGGHDLAAFVQCVNYAAQVSRDERDGHVWVVRSIAEWCDEAVLTPRQAERVIAALVQMGVIVRWQDSQSMDRRAWTRIDYDVLFGLDPVVMHHPQTRIHSTTERVASSPPNGGDVPSSRSSKESIEEQPRAEPLPIDVPDPFDAFWAAYPRKVAKPDALKAWRATKPPVPPAAVMAGLQPWLAYWRVRADPDFVPHPATWLRQRRWDDVPPPVTRRVGRQDVAAAADAMVFDEQGRYVSG